MPLADVLLRLVTDEPLSRDERWDLAVLVLQLLRARGTSAAEGTVPLTPSDLSLSPDLAPRCRAVLAAWDARDPWTPNNAMLEQAVTATLSAVTAPRIVLLPSPAHAAKFLRDIVEQAGCAR